MCVQRQVHALRAPYHDRSHRQKIVFVHPRPKRRGGAAGLSIDELISTPSTTHTHTHTHTQAMFHHCSYKVELSCKSCRACNPNPWSHPQPQALTLRSSDHACGAAAIRSASCSGTRLNPKNASCSGAFERVLFRSTTIGPHPYPDSHTQR